MRSTFHLNLHNKGNAPTYVQNKLLKKQTISLDSVLDFSSVIYYINLHAHFKTSFSLKHVAFFLVSSLYLREGGGVRSRFSLLAFFVLLLTLGN